MRDSACKRRGSDTSFKVAEQLRSDRIERVIMTRQEFEIRSANVRAKAYIGSGSRLALMSRAVVGGFLLAVCVSFWIVRVSIGC